MSLFMHNQIWIGIDHILLNFIAAFNSVLGQQVAVSIRISQIRWNCVLCLFTYWALAMASQTSLFYCISCHQSCRIAWKFIYPIPFLDSILFYSTYA